MKLRSHEGRGPAAARRAGAVMGGSRARGLWAVGLARDGMEGALIVGLFQIHSRACRNFGRVGEQAGHGGEGV